ncbi:hypothetical protein SAMN06269185_2014 [Natronoarchaeum philippinense]|uniref:Cytochrome C and Quinol oxidase polypeptide I n=1 Tax=Natronoarchaeum philippinense TaxID=558529 RepID=A0A285NU92_NATPI|nr:hypothetical protein [Natronoarchaeum philippinense]SNZ13015.1 hypothetical protein SAMN06269185_2014 [Natronoarchaeum philippinense]
MSAVPGNVDTDRQPPMTVPLRHFVVALAFLLAGIVLGLGDAAGRVSGLAGLAHVHLLLVGWVCVTIMGAMTQFVPVWSGVELHSRRLAVVQLWLVTVGLVGFVVGLQQWRPAVLPWFGAAMVLGFWTFAYNVGRTLAAVEHFDVTERHFAAALGFFVLLTTLGLLLALDFARPFLFEFGIARGDVVAAHATLGVFGAVLTTVVGALYQLATMFTQTELHGVDVSIRRFEEVAYPVGVLALAGGRLAASAPIARLGGALVALSLLGVGVVLARRLYETRVEWTPMLSRYAVAAPALALWALLTLPAWLRTPLDPATRFGAPGTGHLLAFGAVGFVVLGTVYHVVPFIVWVHRYSDLLGFEDVPMIDDLYDDRLAAADFALLLAGFAAITASDWLAGDALGAAALTAPEWLVPVGGALAGLGAALFVVNVALVLRNHGQHTLRELLVGGGTDGEDASTPE